jgi:hypothetical protein
MTGDSLRTIVDKKTIGGTRTIAEATDITTTRERANKRNTINIKKENMNLDHTILKIPQSRDHSKMIKITREDNKEESSGVRIERRAARIGRGIRATRTENTKHQNKNTVVIIEVKKRMRSLCLYDKKAIEKNKPVRAHLVAAIPAIISRNKSSIEANIPMIVKPITKNSTQAAAHEVIADL